MRTCNPAIRAKGLRREAFVQVRHGEGEAALATMRAALDAAQQSGNELLEAQCVETLGWVMSLTQTEPEKAPAMVRRALAVSSASGTRSSRDARGCGSPMPMWDSSSRQKRRKPALQALALARQCGDLSCQGATLNLLAWFEADQAKALKMRQQALAAYVAAGNLHGMAIIIGNLGSMAVGMGLYRQARRQLAEADAMHRRMGNQGAIAVNSGNLFEAELRMGNLEAARVAGAEAAEIVRALNFRRFAGWASGYLGRLALAEGRYAEAVRLYERACEEQGPHNDGVLMALEGDHGTRSGQGGRAREGAGGHPPRGRAARGEGPRLAGRHGPAGPLVAACAGARGEPAACRGGQRADQGLRISRRAQCATG